MSAPDPTFLEAIGRTDLIPEVEALRAERRLLILDPVKHKQLQRERLEEAAILNRRLAQHFLGLPPDHQWSGKS